MKSIRLTGVVALIASALVASLTAQADRSEVLLEAAGTKFRVEGKPQEAIALYERVIGDTQARPSTRAKATLGKAQVLELLGKPEAVTLYQRVIQQFPDQKESVAVARAKSAALTAKSGAGQDTNDRRLFTLDFLLDDVSSDGRFALGWTMANPGAHIPGFTVTLVDTASGQSRALTVTPSVMASGDTQGRAFFMPGGREIAYGVIEDVAGALRHSLYVMSIQAGAEPRQVLAPTTRRFSVHDASPDGASLLVVEGGVQAGSTSRRLAWVSVASGAITDIGVVDPGRGPMRPRVSPDGNYIAFHALARAGSTDRHLFTIDRYGNHQQAVVSLAGDNRGPQWDVNGANLFFLSTRTSRSALWGVPMRGGVAAGEPVIVKADNDWFVAKSGNIYYQAGGEEVEQTHIVDRRSGQVINTYVGAGAAALSPNGKQLAYHRDSPVEIIVRNLETGEERVHPRPGLSPAQPRWMPDGSRVLVSVPGDAETKALGGSRFFLDTATGTYARITTVNTVEHQRSNTAEPSPDGKSLFMLFRTRPGDPWEGVVRMDLATLSETVIARFTGTEFRGGTGFAISPDGATLALALSSNERLNEARLLTVKTDGSGYREIYGPFRATILSSNIRWTPDGSILFFSVAADGQWRLMRIDGQGGQPSAEPLDYASAAASTTGTPLLKTSPEGLDVSPDGSQVTFSAVHGVPGEVRILENAASALRPH